MKVAVIFLFLLIIVFSFINLFYGDKRSYSINKFLWLYILIFWGTIPLFQYLTGIFPWNIDVTDRSAFKANILVLVWIFLYFLTYRKFSNGSYKSEFKDIPIDSFSISFLGILVLLLIQFFIFLFFYYSAGGFVFLRGDASRIVLSDTQSVRLILDRVFRSLSTFTAIVLFLNYKSNRDSKKMFYFSISLVLLLLTSFPLATARYMAGAFYIGLFFIYKPYFKMKSSLYIGFLILFLMIYPALSYVRWLVTLSGFEITLWNPALFLTGDYDNFSTLNMTINFVEQEGITIGRQLLGVLLFFVPRSVWPSKPIGSGHHIAEWYGMDFTNISCSFLAEGYINFGIFGVILFAGFMGYVLAKLDLCFYKPGKLSFIKIFYPVSLGMIFFILRGDLMSSFAYTVSFSVSAIIVLLLSAPFIRYLGK